jgi:hypothetical protein
MKSRNSITPQARTNGIVVEHLADEVLVYDLTGDRAHCLNLTAARVWEQCDGQRTISEIAAEVVKGDAEAAEEVVWLAVEELSRAGLMEEKIKRPSKGLRGRVGVSRRELIKRIAVAAAVGVPVVTSIVAPTASHAANCIPSGGGCTVAANCCSGVCNAGRCV